MKYFLVFIASLHGTLFMIDEHFFHKKRGLVKGELLSSIIDGILFLTPITLTVFTRHSFELEKIYIVLSVLSCISISKNEFFYRGIEQKERLIHSALYVLHPILLYTFYMAWISNFFAIHLNFWTIQLVYLAMCVQTMAYKTVYWNYIHGK